MARSALLRLARSQANNLYSRNFQSGYHLGQLPTWPHTRGPMTDHNSATQLADIQNRWLSQSISAEDDTKSSFGYHLGGLPTWPHAPGAMTLPNSASQLSGIQKRCFSQSTSADVTKVRQPEIHRPFVPFKPTGNLYFIDAQHHHNNALLEKMRLYHSVSGSDEDPNLSAKKTLRPLSPHLPIYKPQLNSTTSILNRISSIVLVAGFLFPILYLKMGLICLTYPSFYLFSYYASKLTLISAEIMALAFVYHLYKGVQHLMMDFSGKVFFKK